MKTSPRDAYSRNYAKKGTVALCIEEYCQKVEIPPSKILKKIPYGVFEKLLKNKDCATFFKINLAHWSIKNKIGAINEFTDFINFLNYSTYLNKKVKMHIRDVWDAKKIKNILKKYKKNLKDSAYQTKSNKEQKELITRPSHNSSKKVEKENFFCDYYSHSIHNLDKSLDATEEIKRMLHCIKFLDPKKFAPIILLVLWTVIDKTCDSYIWTFSLKNVEKKENLLDRDSTLILSEKVKEVSKDCLKFFETWPGLKEQISLVISNSEANIKMIKTFRYKSKKSISLKISELVYFTYTFMVPPWRKMADYDRETNF